MLHPHTQTLLTICVYLCIYFWLIERRFQQLTIYRQMTEYLINSELENIWKQPVLA
jgi:hypothetical protein